MKSYIIPPDRTIRTKTAREREAYKRRLLAAFVRWRDILDLNHWRITVQFQDEPYSQDDDDNHTVAVTSATSKYLRAQINVAFADTAVFERDAEEVVVHELLHVAISCLVHPLLDRLHVDGAKFALHLEEQVVTQLARTFVRLAKASPRALTAGSKEQSPDSPVHNH